MKAAVLTFPGSNCDRDAHVALEAVTGQSVSLVWHKESELPAGLDLLVIPGGFSYGDYLRCGAIAARSPIIDSVRQFADAGGYILGVCNGFQVLCEIGILPGTLLRNKSLNFICKPQALRRNNETSVFTRKAGDGVLSIPIAHHDGNYFADSDMISRLEAEDRIAFKYDGNPNGSINDIAGVLSENHRVLGMMPHPERAVGKTEVGADGLAILGGIMN